MTSDPITHLNAALEGRYRIERQIGEGGMATVYLADDLRHERKVALKVLKPELAAVVGADRFLAEIKTTANLQHPHILPLFDSGEADNFLFYVMPYVEGESLRERLDREHQLPVDEAVKITSDVADALQAAHEQGVIHRDVKPANILLSKGRPLVSDFGIALALGAAGAGRLTETGLSLGTPHYMSPEQATGDLSVGASTDIYALGCVLYEMLVGSPPFVGSTPQAVLGKIVTGEAPSASAERKSVPLHVDAAIRKDLEKLPADRFASARQFAEALGDEHFRHGELEPSGGGVGAAGLWNRLSVATTALLAVVTAALGWSLLRPAPPGPLARFSSPFEEGQAPATFSLNAMEFTADGTALVYVGPAVEGAGTQLWLRRWSDVDATPIPGTEGGRSPVLSPDEREVAFSVGDAVRVAPLVGGPSRTLVAEAATVGVVWDWTPDGFVYFREGVAMSRVPSTGGDQEAVESLTELLDGESLHRFLNVLPGGQMAVFQIVKDPSRDGSEVWALDLSTRERHFLTVGNTPRYASTGHLLFATADGVLMAQPIDPSTAELTGSAVPVVEGLSIASEFAAYAVSEGGTLIYAEGDAGTTSRVSMEPVWVTRSGEAVPVDPGWRVRNIFLGYGLRLSPDGTRVAFPQGRGETQDIWIKHLPDGPVERVTTDDRFETSPFWSPDGESVAYDRAGEVWQSRIDGTGLPQPVLVDEGPVSQGRWSRDGEWMLLRTGAWLDEPDGDIVGFRPDLDSMVMPLIATAGVAEESPVLSPNGRWLAYSSDATGRREVYVRPFPDVDSDLVSVSRDGGQHPLWSHSGTELLFVDDDRGLVAAEVEADSVFRVLRRETLFTLGREYFLVPGVDHYDIGPDDERFLMTRVPGAGADPGEAARFILVENWFTELCERMGDC